MLALVGGGMGAVAPIKKKRCHPEERPQACGDEGSRAAPIYKGRRGACKRKFDVNNRNG